MMSGRGLLSRIGLARWGRGDGLAIEAFDERAFLRRLEYKENYKELCSNIAGLLDFGSMLDLGCGNGFMLEPMADLGKEVLGVELSPHAVDLIRPDLRGRVVVADVTGFEAQRDFDLVACVEVAEHIPGERSERLVDVICENAGRWVYFTAASPYQPGHGHVNCRQQFFWMSLFRKRGFELDWERTERLQESIADLRPAVWLYHNSLIFRGGCR